MMLSKTMKRQSKETYILLYVPLLRGHLRTEAQSKIDDIKQAVIEMGGKTNAGCRFLKAGCKTHTVPVTIPLHARGVADSQKTNMTF